MNIQIDYNNLSITKQNQQQIEHDMLKENILRNSNKSQILESPSYQFKMPYNPYIFTPNSNNKNFIFQNSPFPLQIQATPNNNNNNFIFQSKNKENILENSPNFYNPQQKNREFAVPKMYRSANKQNFTKSNNLIDYAANIISKQIQTEDKNKKIIIQQPKFIIEFNDKI
ncbi:hypothetical protein IMG5_091070 [Ichthyophthirius multifiliis]|uniref:Uncharacterized protein n=1 Tax=Ichthyophthirius multifiliis TaxID=5932 RepID=G0QRA6_ICHMU|nr:hypothetical protein IMG5_091070 [Ichthyophthirius multifiliis]EGR32258.1 hypothetical protein IMG5_091070 [Ichthyophthirius multifiliis]|eukprot:XP_004035744.1 hypothetical protein IMG5_091070 [Ichthyophthirius multifiliis]